MSRGTYGVAPTCDRKIAFVVFLRDTGIDVMALTLPYDIAPDGERYALISDVARAARVKPAAINIALRNAELDRLERG